MALHINTYTSEPTKSDNKLLDWGQLSDLQDGPETCRDQEEQATERWHCEASAVSR